MSKEKPLSEKRSEWVNKWVRRRLTGRAIAELKQQDKEAVKRLKAALSMTYFSSMEHPIAIQCNISKDKIIDEIFGDLK